MSNFPVAPGWHETLVGNQESRTKPLFATIASWVDPSCTVVGALASENDTILWEIWYRISSIKSVVFALFCSENNHWVHNVVSSHATNWVIVLIIVKPALKIIEIRQTNNNGEVRFSGEALLSRTIFSDDMIAERKEVYWNAWDPLLLEHPYPIKIH